MLTPINVKVINQNKLFSKFVNYKHSNYLTPAIKFDASLGTILIKVASVSFPSNCKYCYKFE